MFAITMFADKRLLCEHHNANSVTMVSVKSFLGTFFILEEKNAFYIIHNTFNCVYGNLNI